MSFGDFSLDLSDIGKKENAPDPNTVYDMLIAGGGPASMTAAVYGARKLMNLAIITYDFGGQMGYTSWIENYMGFQTVTGEELVKKFQEQVEQFEIPVLMGQMVTKIEKDGDLFKMTTDTGKVFQGRTVIISTGKRDRKLNVPGEKELVGRGVAYCATCDAPFFKNKKVAVAGGGNSAFTAAQDLQKLASEVTLINFAKGWQGDEILYKKLAGMENVTMIDNTQITKINGENKVESISIKDRATEIEKDIEVDGIFIEIGLIPNSEPVAGLVDFTPWKEVIVDCNAQTNVPGLFGAGDVTTVPYKQIVISAGEGAKAALAAYDYLTTKGLM